MADSQPIPRCRAYKQGRVDLTCELDPDHDGWHKAACTSHQDVTTRDAHHVIDLTETVTWEPLDHAGEAARHVIAAAARS